MSSADFANTTYANYSFSSQYSGKALLGTRKEKPTNIMSDLASFNEKVKPAPIIDAPAPVSDLIPRTEASGFQRNMRRTGGTIANILEQARQSRSQDPLRVPANIVERNTIHIPRREPTKPRAKPKRR